MFHILDSTAKEHLAESVDSVLKIINIFYVLVTLYPIGDDFRYPLDPIHWCTLNTSFKSIDSNATLLQNHSYLNFLDIERVIQDVERVIQDVENLLKIFSTLEDYFLILDLKSNSRIDPLMKSIISKLRNIHLFLMKDVPRSGTCECKMCSKIHPVHELELKQQEKRGHDIWYICKECLNTKKECESCEAYLELNFMHFLELDNCICNRCYDFAEWFWYSHRK